MNQTRLREFLLSRPVALAIVLAALTFAAFGRAIGFDFVSWDDGLHVYENPYLAPVSSGSLVHFWTHSYHSLYVPVSYMVFAGLSVIARTNGHNPSLTEFECSLNPHVFHLAGIFLHCVNAVLVFLIIRKAVKSDVGSALGALIFAIHPLQVESVAWISEIRGVLSATFGLSAALLYLQNDGNERSLLSKKSLLSITLFALSLLSKPSAVMIPFVLLAWDVLFFGKNLRTSSIPLIPWFCLTFADMVVTHLVQPASQIAQVPLLSRLSIVGDSLGFYIQKTIWPVGLATEYGRTPARVLANNLQMVTISILLATLALCALVSNRRKWVVGSLLTFFLFLLPVTGLVPFAYQYFSTVADRYVYLALLGPSFALAFGLNSIRKVQLLKWSTVLAAVVLLALTVLTVRQAGVWKNTGTLFVSAIAVNPDDWLPHDQLAGELLLHHDYQGAEHEARIVISRGPSDGKFWTVLGQSVQGQKRYSEADADFTQALAIDPDSPIALYGRAQCEMMTGSDSASINDFYSALRTLPPTTYANYQLAMLLGQHGDYRGAADQFSQCIQRHPDFLNAYYYLAMTFAKSGNSKQASEVAKAALAIDPKFTAVLTYAAEASDQTSAQGH